MQDIVLVTLQSRRLEMSKKVFTLISGVTTGLIAVAEAVVVFAEPPYHVAICACLPVIEGAIVTCCGFFVKDKQNV